AREYSSYDQFVRAKPSGLPIGLERIHRVVQPGTVGVQTHAIPPDEMVRRIAHLRGVVEVAAGDHAAAEGRHRKHAYERSTAKRAPQGTVPPSQMVRRGASCLGELPAHDQLRVVHDELIHSVVGAGTQRSPAGPVPSSNVADGKAARTVELATDNQFPVVN